MSSNISPEGGDGGAPEPPVDPFADIRAAGIDPEKVNWSELASKAQYVDALTDPNHHLDTLESSLREWGHLQENQSLSDFFSQGAPPAPPAYEQGGYQQQGPEVVGYTAEGDPIFSAPPGQEPGFDAQQFERNMMQRVEQMVSEATGKVTEQTRQEIVAQQMADDLDRQMERAKTAHNLDDSEASFLWDNVRARIANMPGLVDPAQVHGLVESTWGGIDAQVNARLQRLAQTQQQRPATTDITGPAPVQTGQQPGQTPYQGMMAETARRLGIEP